MNCSEFEVELERLVETRQDRMAEMATQHMGHCADCRQLWLNHRLIDAAVHALGSIEPPAGMTESVMRQLLSERMQGQSSSVRAFKPPASERRGSWLTVAAAAACLIGLFSMGLWLGRETPRQLAVAPSPQDSSKPSNVELATSVAAVFEDIRTEYRELAAETSASARDFAVVIPPGVNSVWKSNEQIPPESGSTVEQPGAIEPVSSSSSVSKIGRSFGKQIGQAIDFLWAAVPDTVPRG